jgi:anti-anti-sigma factor
MRLDIQITEVGSGGRRIALRGRLDTESAPALDERLEPLLASPVVTAALFDLAGLEYIGSAGIRVLVKTRKTLEARGGGMAVANLQPTVRRVFEIVKALPSTDVLPTPSSTPSSTRCGGGPPAGAPAEERASLVRPACTLARDRRGGAACPRFVERPRRRSSRLRAPQWV